MPYGVGDAADGAHVAAQFEQFEGGLEHAVGVGHLLGADESAATLVGGRGDQLVDHGVGAAAAVVAVGHLLADAVAQVVGGPAFALGDVVGEGAFEGEEPASVGLGACLHTLAVAPVEEGLGIALVEQFGLGELEVVSHFLYLMTEVG